MPSCRQFIVQMPSQEQHDRGRDAQTKLVKFKSDCNRMANAKTKKQQTTKLSKMLANKFTRYISSRNEVDNTYIRCAVCHCLTPFMFWVVSTKALDKYFNTSLNTGVPHLFCVKCLPSSTDSLLYSENCLFNNNDFLSLFHGYEYYDPRDQLYSKTPRLILTEDTKIHPKYKTLMKPMPRLVKLRKLFQVIPEVHQVSFDKYSTWTEVDRHMRMKQREISGNYNEQLLNNSLMDNVDVTVERTPFRSASESASQPRQSRTILLPTDTNIVRSATQESDHVNAANLQLSSQSLSGSDSIMPLTGLSTQESNISSQTLEQQTESFDKGVSIEEVNISSQTLEQQTESLQSGSSFRSIDNVVKSTDRNRPVFHDSQEAGPSGLQLQHIEPDPTPVQPPKAKRRRISTPAPVNPSPVDVPAMRGQNTRLPRLPGG